MNPVELAFLAIALAMDAFAVAVASGMVLATVGLRQTFRLSWHFGLFQALMPVIGWFLGQSVHAYIKDYDHWVAFALLTYIGVKMIRESFAEDELRHRVDPTRGWALVVLSVATSIDALAVGLSLSMLRLSIWFPALVIGLVAAVFTGIGLHLGRTVSRARRLGRVAEWGGGTVLIAIGGRILWTHLVASSGAGLG